MEVVVVVEGVDEETEELVDEGVAGVETAEEGAEEVKEDEEGVEVEAFAKVGSEGERETGREREGEWPRRSCCCKSMPGSTEPNCSNGFDGMARYCAPGEPLMKLGSKRTPGGKKGKAEGPGIAVWNGGKEVAGNSWAT